MRRTIDVALVSLGLLLGTTGCDAFLTGNKLSENPNLPTAASIQPLFVGVQAGQFTFQEATAATSPRTSPTGSRCTAAAGWWTSGA